MHFINQYYQVNIRKVWIKYNDKMFLKKLNLTYSDEIFHLYHYLILYHTAFILVSVTTTIILIVCGLMLIRGVPIL